MTEPIEVFRKDYKPSSWQISDISLSFILHETETLVSGTYNIQSSDARYSHHVCQPQRI